MIASMGELAREQIVILILRIERPLPLRLCRNAIGSRLDGRRPGKRRDAGFAESPVGLGPGDSTT